MTWQRGGRAAGRRMHRGIRQPHPAARLPHSLPPCSAAQPPCHPFYSTPRRPLASLTSSHHTHLSTSAASASATRKISSSVRGSSTAKVLPLAASTHSLLISSCAAEGEAGVGVREGRAGCCCAHACARCGMPLKRWGVGVGGGCRGQHKNKVEGSHTFAVAILQEPLHLQASAHLTGMRYATPPPEMQQSGPWQAIRSPWRAPSPAAGWRSGTPPPPWWAEPPARGSRHQGSQTCTHVGGTRAAGGRIQPLAWRSGGLKQCAPHRHSQATGRGRHGGEGLGSCPWGGWDRLGAVAGCRAPTTGREW